MMEGIKSNDTKTASDLLLRPFLFRLHSAPVPAPIDQEPTTPTRGYKPLVRQSPTSEEKQ